MEPPAAAAGARGQPGTVPDVPGRRNGAGRAGGALRARVPGDGAAGVAAQWATHPDTPWYVAPAVRGGIMRQESRDLFRRYAAKASDSAEVRWARTLANLP
jgi:hypothetical protein